MIGPFVNGLSTLVGGLAGGSLGHHLPEKYRARLPLTFGCASMGMGVSMIIKLNALPAVIASLLLGSIIGEFLSLEHRIGRVAAKGRFLLDRFAPARTAAGLTHEQYLDKFVGVLVLFVASGVGVFGAMNEGVTGDPTILLTKSLLDFFTAGIFAAALGLTVAAIAIPQVMLQALLLWLGKAILSLTTPQMIADFSGLGGVIMLATGFRISGVKSFPVANLLPGLFIVMPISRLWTTTLTPWIASLGG